MKSTRPFRRRIVRGSFALGLGLLGLTAIAGDLTKADEIGAAGRAAYSPPVQQGQSQYGAKGRYSTLLKKIEVPNDQVSYGDFCDYGYYSGTSYAGFSDLPPGYWVYLAPHWYIYKDAAGVNPVPSTASWSAIQATGKPNTPQAGDHPTAWASATADGQREWLELTYDADYEAVGVMVYESHSPGAVDSVIAYAGNEQVEVWAGKDPTEAGKPSGVSLITFKTPVKTSRVRISIDSPSVPGWNEIDAVGLIDKEGNVHWATSATASSCWGTNTAGNLGEAFGPTVFYAGLDK
jgi:hypothetical protein